MWHLIMCLILLLATDVSHGTLTRLPEGITLHNGKVTWSEARAQCEREGAVLAAPIDTKAFDAMKSVVEAWNFTFHTGMKATYLPGQFVSIEGIALENIPLSALTMAQELDQWEGECLAMSRDSIRSMPCKSRLPYMCYNAHINKNNTKKTNCGPADEGYKYDVSTGNCYKIYTLIRIWDEAHGTCASEGGHLAIIEDLQQAQAIKNMYNFARSDYIYLGLRKYFFKYGWISIHGQPVEELYNDWVDSVPQPGVDYQCGALHRSGKLEKFPCSRRFPYVCQRKAK